MSATIIATVCRDGQEQYSIASKEDTVLLPEVQAARLRRAVKHCLYWKGQLDFTPGDMLTKRRECGRRRDDWYSKAEDERADTYRLADAIACDDLRPAWEKSIVVANLRRLAEAAFEDIPSDRFDVSKIYRPDYGKE